MISSTAHWFPFVTQGTLTECRPSGTARACETNPRNWQKTPETGPKPRP